MGIVIALKMIERKGLSAMDSFPGWDASDSHSVLGKLDFFFEACMQPLPVAQG
jgi:hypothetical protein